jgi:proline iminopeptidase
VTAENATHARSGVVDVDGAQLRYVIEGEGQPCLVVGSSVFYPRIFSEDLRRHVQLVNVDLRHFADPEHPASAEPSFSRDQITIDSYAADIERVRQALGLGDVVVIGHSIHSLIALEYARRYPEHVLGAVPIGGIAGTEGDEAATDALWETAASPERKELFARRRVTLTPELRASLSPAEYFVRSYVTRGPWYWYDPEVDSSWLWEDVVPDMPIFERLGELFDPYDLDQGPGEISVPVLVVDGKFDFGAPWTNWEAHAHKLPRHTLAFFERSAHFPSLEEPELFDQTLLAWIGGLAPGRRRPALPGGLRSAPAPDRLA